MTTTAAIEWLDWSDEAFSRAASTQRPILLRIGASWCASSNLMARESDCDPVVVSAINESFVPVFVDSDRHPEINERYSMGGWPTNAFLTPRGELITGGTYFDVDTFRRLLNRVAQNWSDRRAEVEDAVAANRRHAEQRRRARLTEGPPTAATVEAVVSAAMDEFDFRYGGFGREPKFSHASTIDLLLAEFARTGETRLRDAALLSLEAMWSPGEGHACLADRAGGFFRYAGARDWSEPRYEKLLDDNAQLLLSYLAAYQSTGDARWSDAARSIVGYIRSTLTDTRRRVFMASQSATPGEAYYDLPPEERGRVEAPSVDKTAFVAGNAITASAFVRAGLLLNDDAVLEFGAVVANGLVANARASEDEPLLGHVVGKGGGEGAVLLSSQVYVARALVDTYEAMGGHARLQAAAGLLDEVHSHLMDPAREAYADTIVEVGAEGYLSHALHPLTENSVAAETLLRLSLLLDAPAYEARAQSILRAFSGNAGDYGFLAAPYASVVIRTLAKAPVHVQIAGSPTSGQGKALARAAHAGYSPTRVVRFLEPDRDRVALKAFGGKKSASVAARVGIGLAFSQATSDPSAIEALVARASAAAFD